MSHQFNDTSTNNGLVQIYELEAGLNLGDISGDTTLLKQFAVEVNATLDDYFAIGIQASGTWQLDDSNHTKNPEITTNLVSGQRNYSFTVDEQSNLILDIFKVMVADSNGTFHEIFPIDKQSDRDTQAFYDGTNPAGFPQYYDKTGNSISFDYLPNYNYTNGVKVFINREGSYFVYSDTTKKPGVPGLHHRYFALKPAFNRARRLNLPNYNTLAVEILKYEGDENRNIIGSIARHFGKREKDVRKVLSEVKTDFV